LDLSLANGAVEPGWSFQTPAQQAGGAEGGVTATIERLVGFGVLELSTRSLNLFFHASVIPLSTLSQDLDRLPGPCAYIAFTFSHLPTPAVERERPAFCFTPQHQNSLPAR